MLAMAEVQKAEQTRATAVPCPDEGELAAHVTMHSLRGILGCAPRCVLQPRGSSSVALVVAATSAALSHGSPTPPVPLSTLRFALGLEWRFVVARAMLARFCAPLSKRTNAWPGLGHTKSGSLLTRQPLQSARERSAASQCFDTAAMGSRPLSGLGRAATERAGKAPCRALRSATAPSPAARGSLRACSTSTL